MLEVLVGSRDFGHGGGVVAMVRSTMCRFRRVHAEHFPIGRAVGGAPGDLLSPLRDNLGLHRRKVHFDLLHLNPSMRLRAVLRDGVLLANWGDRPSVVTFHGWDDALVRHFRRNRAARSWLLAAYGRSALIVLAERFRADLVGLGFAPDAVRVIPPAFDGTPFAGLTPSPSQRVIFVGRLSSEKGLFALLQAFAQVGIGELVLLGEGPERHTAEAWIAEHELRERVHFRGYLTGREKAQELLNASVFALPSRSEGVPIAMLEAMAAGLPVVVTDVGGIAEVVQNVRNGWLLPNGTVDALARALREALTHPHAGMRSWNRDIAWSTYEASVVTPQIEAVYLATAEAWS